MGKTLEARPGNQSPDSPPVGAKPTVESPVVAKPEPVSPELAEMVGQIKDTASTLGSTDSPQAIQHDAQVFVGEKLSREFGNKSDATRNKGVVIKIPTPAGRG